MCALSKTRSAPTPILAAGRKPSGSAKTNVVDAALGDLRRSAMILVTLSLVVTFSGGCISLRDTASLNDDHYEWTQRTRAKSEYRRAGKPGHGTYAKDYKLGWLDGFYEVATGGPCCPPVIAPQRYWEPDEVLENCDAPRASYYAGWQAGAAQASQFPDTHHLRLHETGECYIPRCDRACGAAGPAGCGCVTCGVGPAAGSLGWGGMVADQSLLEVDPAPPLAPVVVQDLPRGPATRETTRDNRDADEDLSLEDSLSLPDDGPAATRPPATGGRPAQPPRGTAPPSTRPTSPDRPAPADETPAADPPAASKLPSATPGAAPRSLSDEARPEPLPLSEEFEFLPTPAKPPEPTKPFGRERSGEPEPKSFDQQVDEAKDTISLPVPPRAWPTVPDLSGDPGSLFPQLDWRLAGQNRRPAGGSRR